MDHSTAVQTRSAERYFLDELSELQREEFEQHFFECPECAAHVSDGAAFMSAAREHLVRQAAPPARPAGRPRGLAASAGPLVRRIAAGLVVGLLGFASYQRFVTIPRIEREAVERERAAADAGRRLSPSFLKVSRGEPTAIAIARSDRFFLVRLSDSLARPYSAYRVTVLDASGRERWSQTVRSASATDELEVVIPGQGLPDGPYVLELEGMADEGGAPAGAEGKARYAFTLARRE
ncbi:MAG: zf-HC2 domain-containing protein [Vicinamibacteria bacterium]